MKAMNFIEQLKEGREAPLTEEELLQAQKTDKKFLTLCLLLCMGMAACVSQGLIQVACLFSLTGVFIIFSLYGGYMPGLIRVVKPHECARHLSEFQESTLRMDYLAKIHAMNRPVWACDIEFAKCWEQKALGKTACKQLHGVTN